LHRAHVANFEADLVQATRGSLVALLIVIDVAKLEEARAGAGRTA
jgi:hypothetical protein